VKLITAHRILIAAAIVFFVFYAVVQARRYLDVGSVGALVQALVSLGVAAALRFYYRTLAQWGKR
jgi:hypothetical protein